MVSLFVFGLAFDFLLDMQAVIKKLIVILFVIAVIVTLTLPFAFWGQLGR